jgi:DNA-binding response OmpR family regulator
MNETALIIEDEIDLANIFAEAIKAADFEVEIIQDGLVAQSRLKENLPKLVILDMHLPHVDGSVLLKQIRSEPLLEKTIVIIATADGQMAERFSGQADLVLVKPISFMQLRDLAARLKLRK